MVWRKNDNFPALHASRHDLAAFQSAISHEHLGPSSRRDLSGLMGRGVQKTEFHDLKVFFLYDWLTSRKLTATGERSNWRGRHALACRKRSIGTFAGPFVVNFGFL